MRTVEPARDGLWVTTPLVRLALASARERGADVAPLSRRFLLPASAETERFITVRFVTMRQVVAATAELVGDPFWGLYLAGRYERGTYGVVEYACRCAPTLREALKRVCTYMPLVSQAAVAQLEEGFGRGVLRWHVPGFPDALGRHANEFLSASILRLARELTGARVAPLRLSFVHPAPDSVDQLLSAFDVSAIDFGAGLNEMEIACAELDLPVLSADPHLLALLDRMACEDAKREGESLLAAVQSQIRLTLPGQAPDVGSVARSLGMSARTLQRHLRQEGIPFKKLLDSVRFELAQTYLDDPHRTVKEITHLLGYAAPAPFARAYRRWSGASPAELAKRRATRSS